jgi:hypothetical protein
MPMIHWRNLVLQGSGTKLDKINGLTTRPKTGGAMYITSMRYFGDPLPGEENATQGQIVPRVRIALSVRKTA